jgi:hypothetical protein
MRLSRWSDAVHRRQPGEGGRGRPPTLPGGMAAVAADRDDGHSGGECDGGAQRPAKIMRWPGRPDQRSGPGSGECTLGDDEVGQRAGPATTASAIAVRDSAASAGSAACRPSAASTAGSTSAQGPDRRRNSAACRRAIPHIQPPAAPAGRYRSALRQTPRRVSWSTSSTSAARSTDRSHPASHGACRENSSRKALSSPTATAAISSPSSIASLLHPGHRRFTPAGKIHWGTGSPPAGNDGCHSRHRRVTHDPAKPGRG